MSVVVMGMLRQICGKTLQDRIKQKSLLNGRVALIENKSENRLMWFGYDYRKLVDARVRSSDMVTIDGGTNDRGRQKECYFERIQVFWI